MDTLSVAEVNEMIASGDIDFERFKKLASDAKATGHLLNILGSEVLEDEEEE